MKISLNVGPIDHNDGKYKDLLKDLQGNILKSHGRECAALLFLTFNDGEKKPIQEAIRKSIAPMITSASQQFAETENKKAGGPGGGLFVNFLLSAAGYHRINKKVVVDNSDVAFAKGLRDRGEEKLKDPPVDDWEAPYRNTIHALVILADRTETEVKQAAQNLLAKLNPVLVSHHLELGEKLANASGDAIEHFGYVDGTSQPIFLRSDLSKLDAKDFDKFDPSAFLKNVLVKDPNGEGDYSHGSYMVFRKLEQNVRAFREAEVRLAEQLDVAPELAGAFAVGRFRDGTPVVLSGNAGAGGPLNNFDYASDKEGSKCPLHAHIRKANPRGDGVPLDRDRRMARRGMPYGGKEVLEAPFPEAGKGLLFMAFMSKIGGALDPFDGPTQFEFVQRIWANDVDFKEKGVGIDPVIGQGVQSDVPKNWPSTWGGAVQHDDAFDFGRYVTMKGGEYFFAPSISSMMKFGF